MAVNKTVNQQTEDPDMGGADYVLGWKSSTSKTKKILPQNVALSYNPYKFRARSAVDQTGVVGGTWTTVVLGTEDFDTNNNFASNLYTAPVDGYYQFNAQVALANGAGIYTGMGLRLLKNGGVAIMGSPSRFDNNWSMDFDFCTGGDLVFLNAGDTIALQGIVTVSSSTGTFLGSNCILSGHLVSKT